MFVLNLGGDLLQPGADGTIRCGTFLIQPFAQLAFLPARQGEHSGGVFGMQLDERQRLHKAHLLKPYLTTRHQEIDEWNQQLDAPESVLNHRQMTNIGTFRAYLNEYYVTIHASAKI